MVVSKLLCQVTYNINGISVILHLSLCFGLFHLPTVFCALQANIICIENEVVYNKETFFINMHVHNQNHAGLTTK